MSRQAGGFNEEGIVCGMFKKGHDQYTTLSELIDGAADAGATNLRFIEYVEYVYVVDDGRGQKMDEFIESTVVAVLVWARWILTMGKATPEDWCLFYDTLSL